MKARTMNRKTLTVLVMALAPTLLPLTAFAMPAVGDIVGTDPMAAKAALETAGCMVDEFEAENGKIEAKCKDSATGKAMEVYIDPASGAVTEIKSED